MRPGCVIDRAPFLVRSATGCGEASEAFGRCQIFFPRCGAESMESLLGRRRIDRCGRTLVVGRFFFLTRGRAVADRMLQHDAPRVRVRLRQITERGQPHHARRSMRQAATDQRVPEQRCDPRRPGDSARHRSSSRHQTPSNLRGPNHLGAGAKPPTRWKTAQSREPEPCDGIDHRFMPSCALLLRCGLGVAIEPLQEQPSFSF